MTACRVIVQVFRDDADIVSGSWIMWRLSLIMDRTLHRRRLVSLVSFLTIISIVSIMVTDLRFYIDKATERTLTGKVFCVRTHLVYCDILFSVLDYVGPAEINNYGENHNLRLNPERHKSASDDDLKYILFWNEAYGSKVMQCLHIDYIELDGHFRSMTWASEDSHFMTISVRKPAALLLMTGG